MRKFILAALIVVAALASAQGHMTYDGIELNGKIENVVRQLGKKGYTLVSQKDGVVMMAGTFMEQPVMLAPIYTPIAKTVYRIAVMYPDDKNSWPLLSNRYADLKARLIREYGEPDEVIEQFDSPYSAQNDPLKAFELKKATYKTSFKTKNGSVTLNISSYSAGIVVNLIYTDKKNEAKLEAEMGKTQK